MAKNKLTLNVLEDITGKIRGEDNYRGKDNILVVLNGSKIDINNRIQELKELKNQGYVFSLAFSFMSDKIIDTGKIINALNPIEVYKEEDIFQLEEIVKKYSCVIGINMTINTISKISLGMVDSFVSTLIWTYLYKGQPVYLDFSSCRNFLGDKSNNNKINSIIENHIKSLKDLGAREIVPGKYLDVLSHKKDIKKSDNKIKSNILTEGDLEGISQGETLILPKETIITPLAKDKANILGISFKKED